MSLSVFCCLQSNAIRQDRHPPNTDTFRTNRYANATAPHINCNAAANPNERFRGFCHDPDSGAAAFTGCRCNAD